MNIDFAPSPLAISPARDDETSQNGIFFEMEPFLDKTNNLFVVAANGQMADIQTLSTATEEKMLDVLDQNGANALHHAAKMNRVEVIERVLKAGANVDVFSKEGLTPLHKAAR